MSLVRNMIDLNEIEIILRIRYPDSSRTFSKTFIIIILRKYIQSFYRSIFILFQSELLDSHLSLPADVSDIRTDFENHEILNVIFHSPLWGPVESGERETPGGPEVHHRLQAGEDSLRQPTSRPVTEGNQQLVSN